MKWLLGLLLLLSGDVNADTGIASWYGKEFDSKTMANGSPFLHTALTCAHRTLPFGTRLRISYAGKSVVARVTDRGPFVKGRVLDLSEGAFKLLARPSVGIIKVDFEIVKP